MRTPKGFNKLTCVTTLLLATALVSCSDRQDGESDTSKMETGYGYSSMASGYKIVVEEATVEDLIPHKVACPSQKKGKHQEQICIQICHVPPGNPDNAHDKVLPLAAIKAHLGHGDYLGLCGASTNEPPPAGSGEEVSSGSGEEVSSGSGEEVSSGSGEEVSSGSGEEVSSGSGEEVSSGSGEEVSSGSGEEVSSGSGEEVSSGNGETVAEEFPVLPQFCQPYYEVDQDCDGFNDYTGMPYL